MCYKDFPNECKKCRHLFEEYKIAQSYFIIPIKFYRSSECTKYALKTHEIISALPLLEINFKLISTFVNRVFRA